MIRERGFSFKLFSIWGNIFHSVTEGGVQILNKLSNKILYTGSFFPPIKSFNHKSIIEPGRKSDCLNTNSFYFLGFHMRREKKNQEGTITSSYIMEWCANLLRTLV